MLIGDHWPGVDPARIVDAPSWQSFVRPYLFLLLPNMLWLGGCFFVLAALTRQMAPVYVAGVIMLVGYLVAFNLLGDMENRTLAAFIDPSGASAVDVFTRYWSVAQKNSRQIPIEGVLLGNRAVWLGVRRVRDGDRLSRVQHAGSDDDSAQQAERMQSMPSCPRPRQLRLRCRPQCSIAVPARLPACFRA